MYLWSVCVYMLESVVALSVHVCSLLYILYEASFTCAPVSHAFQSTLLCGWQLGKFRTAL